MYMFFSAAKSASTAGHVEMSKSTLSENNMRRRNLLRYAPSHVATQGSAATYDLLGHPNKEATERMQHSPSLSEKHSKGMKSRENNCRDEKKLSDS